MEETSGRIIEWVALGTAIYAALVATMGALWHFRSWRQDRPHVRVEIRFALGETGFDGFRYFVTLNAVNTGRLDIQLSSAGFTIEQGRTLLPMEGVPGHIRSALPHDLLPCRNLSVYFPIPDLFNTLAEKNHGLLPRTAWFQDATGKKYIKRVNRRNMNSWFETVVKGEK